MEEEAEYQKREREASFIDDKKGKNSLVKQVARDEFDRVPAESVVEGGRGRVRRGGVGRNEAANGRGAAVLC